MQSEVHISEVRLRLEPGQGRIPFQSLVESLSVEISSAAFRKIVEQAVRMFAGKLPVEVELSSVRLLDGGAEIVARAKRSILKADLRARLEFSVNDGQAIRVRVAELDAPAWVPAQLVIDQGMSYATTREGVSRVDGDNRAIDLKPETLLAATGAPVTLAQPGAWEMTPEAASLKLRFAS